MIVRPAIVTQKVNLLFYARGAQRCRCPRLANHCKSTCHVSYRDNPPTNPFQNIIADNLGCSHPIVRLDPPWTSLGEPYRQGYRAIDRMCLDSESMAPLVMILPMKIMNRPCIMTPLHLYQHLRCESAPRRGDAVSRVKEQRNRKGNSVVVDASGLSLAAGRVMGMFAGKSPRRILIGRCDSSPSLPAKEPRDSKIASGIPGLALLILD
jgi:hypothetical protein